MEKEDLTETYWENTSPEAKSIDVGQRSFNYIPKHVNKFVALEEFYAWENRISYVSAITYYFSLTFSDLFPLKWAA
jgi:hypothetical protein